MTRLRVIDIETTGTEPPAEIIEFGRVDVVISAEGARIEPPQAWLYRPLRGIPPETMAVHHITEADFDQDTPVCTSDHLHAAVWSGPTPAALVAHNCAFEREFVTEATTGAIPWICTYKAAMHVWPDAPRHSNQVLRYWRALVLDSALAMPPHRAGPDAWVTAHLLADLARYASFDQMVAWTKLPRPMPMLTFGKHRGQTWAQVPTALLAAASAVALSLKDLPRNWGSPRISRTVESPVRRTYPTRQREEAAAARPPPQLFRFGGDQSRK